MKTQSNTKLFSLRCSGKWLRMMFICVCLLLLAVPLSAQVYSTSKQAQSGYISNSAFRVNSRVVTTSVEASAYTPYQSTVYEPFTTIVPSQRAGAGRPDDGAIGDASATGNQNDLVIPDGFGNLADPGYATSPIGEPWMLAIFAALLAVFTAIKSKKHKQE